jgi:hypothetical protein
MALSMQLHASMTETAASPCTFCYETDKTYIEAEVAILTFDTSVKGQAI